MMDYHQLRRTTQLSYSLQPVPLDQLLHRVQQPLPGGEQPDQVQTDRLQVVPGSQLGELRAMSNIQNCQLLPECDNQSNIASVPSTRYLDPSCNQTLNVKQGPLITSTTSSNESTTCSESRVDAVTGDRKKPVHFTVSDAMLSDTERSNFEQNVDMLSAQIKNMDSFTDYRQDSSPADVSAEVSRSSSDTVGGTVPGSAGQLLSVGSSSSTHDSTSPRCHLKEDAGSTSEGLHGGDVTDTQSERLKLRTQLSCDSDIEMLSARLAQLVTTPRRGDGEKDDILRILNTPAVFGCQVSSCEVSSAVSSCVLSPHSTPTSTVTDTSPPPPSAMKAKIKAALLDSGRKQRLGESYLWSVGPNGVVVL